MTNFKTPGLILIVDDNPTNLSVLSKILDDAGFLFRVAMDGEKTLTLIQNQLPDLILLDVRMPGIDGFDVCRRLKSNPRTAEIPIIFATASADIESKAKGFSLGAVDYITKPFQKEEVLARVNVHLRLHTLHQNLQQELKLRRQIEQKLRASEQRYRSLYENTPVMLHSIDATGKIISVSNYWLQKLGYERSEVLGHLSTNFLTEDSRKYAVDVVLPEFLKTGICSEIPYQIRCKSGESIDVLLSAIAEKDNTGQVVRSLAVMVDVTERNRAQAALLQTEKLVALGRLISGIAHELRNPLNFIQNFAEGSIELHEELRDELQHWSSSNLPLPDGIQQLIGDLQENSTSIYNHSERASRIISSMMQHDSPSDDQATFLPTDLHQLLDQAIKLAFHGKKLDDDTFNLSIQRRYDENINQILVMPSTLLRACINLIDNACDAMRSKQKQEKINAKTSYLPRLEISTCQLEHHIEIRLRDNGAGIPSEVQSKIFEPFFTMKSPDQGTGLGLSITHDIIVKQHNGTLALNTELSNYTEFVLTLPNR